MIPISQNNHTKEKDQSNEDIINLIENCENEGEIEEISKKLNNSIVNNKITQQKLNGIINSNENLLKSIIINNTDNIIKLFSNIKEIKEEFTKSKRSLDTLGSQMIM